MQGAGGGRQQRAGGQAQGAGGLDAPAALMNCPSAAAQMGIERRELGCAAKMLQGLQVTG